MTAHEQQEARIEYERTWRKRALDRRKELLRLCPAGLAVDREHVLTMLSQQWSTNAAYLVARHFVVRGLAANGIGGADGAAALGLSPAAWREELARALWWTLPPDAYGEVPEEFHPLVAGPR